MHERSTFVILDVTHPDWFVEVNFLGEALLLEVANRVVVGVSEEVGDGRGSLDVVFQMIHQM